MGRITARRKVTVVSQADTPEPQFATKIDHVIVEEPLEIRVNGKPLTVTMRTPGHDIDLAHGFLFTEGIIGSHQDIHTARYCEGAVVTDETGTPVNTYNVLDISLRAGVPAPSPETSRNFYTTSSCGVCGKASIENIRTKSRYPRPPANTTTPSVIAGLSETLATTQTGFDRTGGTHAAGLFTLDGTLLVAREDVGRHNAVDKVIGHATQTERLPLHDSILMVSSRASFELTQKAFMAGIPILAAVSAPTSLAAELAADVGITLIGFVRGRRFNVYTHPERLSRP